MSSTTATTPTPQTTTTPSGATSALPHETVWALTNAMTTSRCLHVVAERNVADHIDETPVPLEALAAACGVEPEPLGRVLQLLVAHGLFERREDGYTHTEASRLLRTDHPRSMRAFTRMMGLPLFWATFGALDHSLLSGSPSLETVDPRGLWSYLATHPNEARIFDQAMAAKARADTAAVVAAYDFRPFATIADIGGGRGHLLAAVLDAFPSARGVLFDLPAVIETVEVDGERLTLHPGDFFVDPLPRADAYVLMEVLHDWADADAIAVLRAIRRAAFPGATLLVVEGLLADDVADPRAHALDVIMLAVTGGRERTAQQFDALLRAADFRLSTVIQTDGPMRIVEAIAV